MLNSVPSSKNKKDPFILNPFYIYLDTFSTFNQNINKDTIRYIRKVVRGINSHNNKGVSMTNHKVNYGGFLGYLKTWFQKNGLGNIL